MARQARFSSFFNYSLKLLMKNLEKDVITRAVLLHCLILVVISKFIYFYLIFYRGM